MLQRVLSLTKFSGINNVEEELRLPYRGGRSFLSEARNVDIDDSGRIITRKDMSLVESGSFSSLWSDGEFLYGVRNGNVFKGTPGNLVDLCPVTRERVKFCKGADRVFFTGEVYMGEILNFEYSFPEEEITKQYNRTTHELLDKNFSSAGVDSLETVKLYAMPTADFCTVYGARLVVAKGNNLLFSAPFNYLYTVPFNYIQLPARVTSLVGVDNKFLFVGTNKGSIALHGESNNFELVRLTEGKVFLDSARIVHSSKLLDQDERGEKFVVFAQPSGVYVTNGRVANKLTPHYFIGEKKVRGAYIKVAKNEDAYPFYQYCLIMEE
ncbi:hypothetical protein DRN93_01230 [archaeon]|nr:MAG: hypothetical protein DRN93_01230 [archaeon]